MQTGGAFTGHLRPAMLRICALLAAALLAIAVSACGNAAKGPTAAAAPNNIVSQAEIEKYPAGSVQRAFMELWSALQFQAWAEAASYYDPAFRASVHTASIIGAKKVNAPNYPLLKPSIVGLATHLGFTTIKYSLWQSNGTKELASVTWHKVGGNWAIEYDSRLDAELRQFAQNKVEIARKGTLPLEADEVSPDAARAGEKDGQAQAGFTEQELAAVSP